MWKKLSAVVVLVCLLLLPLIFSGCSLEETEENLTTVRSASNTVMPYVPTTHTYIPIAVSSICTAALAVIKILRERGETRRMKKAIKAKGRQIDTVLAAKGNPDNTKEHALKTFMRADKSTADEGKFDALSDFDSVRKGYI